MAERDFILLTTKDIVKRDGRIATKPATSTTCECGCGAEFNRYDAYGRSRRFIPGHNLRGGHG